MYRCCLCDAAGEYRRGQIREDKGERVPLCAEHRAEMRWKRTPVQVAPVDPLIAMIGRAALLAG